ncbi:MAG: hypothetical protein P8P36_00555 [Akkermansiaceae bacterium]|nr:hypothetical protein [Akkermansiaceae bacterium]
MSIEIGARDLLSARGASIHLQSPYGKAMNGESADGLPSAGGDI